MNRFNILIDGYNLRLKKGSGIKSYTLSLIKALEDSVDISLLFDYNILNKDISSIEFSDKHLKGITSNSAKRAIIKDLAKFLLNKSFNEFKFKDDINFQNEESYILNKRVININNIFNLSEASSRFDYYLNIKNIKNIDIFHSTYMLNLNVVGAKRVTTIHDIIPLKLPHTTLDDKKLFYNKVKSAIKNSDKIVTISEHSKKDILELFDIDESKIVNCYQAFTISQKEIEKVNINIYNRFNLKENEYFLFVGNIEPKKNVARLIEAFLDLDSNKKLVIVGRKAWLWEEQLKEAKKFINEGKIVLLDYVSKKELIALYKKAFFFVFPSLYEGFGLPPLEAMACKTPVITSNCSSLPEVCGNAAIYCNPYDESSIKSALEEALNLPNNIREKLIQEGIKRVDFFNLDDYKNRILDVYKSIL